MAVLWGRGGPMPPRWWGSDHEPSHCRHGVWLHADRMFRNDAQPGLPEVDAAARNAGHRVRATGGGSENLVRRELPHALEPFGPARHRVLADPRAHPFSAPSP